MRERHLAAWQHETIPIDRLVAELQPDRQLGRNPFFDLAFQVRDGYFAADFLPGAAAEQLLLHNGTSKFDLDLALVRRDGELVAEVEYDLELFDRATIDLCSSPSSPCWRTWPPGPRSRLSELAMVPERQRELLAAWSATAGGAPTLRRPLARAFPRRGRKPARGDRPRIRRQADL